MKEIYLTAGEMKDIEQLRDYTVGDYIKDLAEDKKWLVMKQYEKESTIRQLKTVAKEKY